MIAAMFAAKVWTFWIGVPLAIMVILAGVATIGGYLMKVVRPKYPPRGRN